MEIFAIVLLVIIAGANSVALSATLSEVLRVRRIICAAGSEAAPLRPKTGLRLPEFVARVLGGNRSVTHGDMLGKETLVLFVNAVDSLKMSAEIFRSFLFSLWSRTDRCLYLVCEGSDEECIELQQHYDLKRMYAETLTILVDSDSSLTARFGVPGLPGAIEYDEVGMAFKVGMLGSAEDASDLQHAKALAS